MKKHKLCSEKEVFEHVNNGKYSEEKGHEVPWKGSQVGE
jgi:hypothetical protein